MTSTGAKNKKKKKIGLMKSKSKHKVIQEFNTFTLERVVYSLDNKEQTVQKAISFWFNFLAREDIRIE